MPTTSSSLENDSPYNMSDNTPLSSKATIIGVSVSFGLLFLTVVLAFLCVWCVRRRHPCVVEKSGAPEADMPRGEIDEERGMEMQVWVKECQKVKKGQQKAIGGAKKVEQETHHKNWWSSPRLSRQGSSELR